MINILLAMLLAVYPPQGKCEGAGLQRLAEKAQVIVVAEIEEVGPPPQVSAWSGLLAVRQGVKYRVRSVLRGQTTEDVMWVSFYLIHGSRTVSRDVPELSPKLFEKTKVHMLFLQPAKQPAAIEAGAAPASSYSAIDANCGAIPAETGLVEEVRRIISKP